MCKLKLIFLALFVSYSATVYAAPPNRTYNYVAHTTIDPNQNNTNENNLYSYLQAGVDTYAAGSIDNTAISNSAGIAYSKLNLIGSITNNDINSSAGIVASKLDLTSPGPIGSTASNTGAFTSLTGTTLFTTGNIGVGTSTANGRLIVQGGNVGIGTVNPNATLTVAGIVYSTSGGFRFPDNTIQTTAPRLGQVFTSSGTFEAPTGVTRVYLVGIAGGGAGAGINNVSNTGGGGGGSGQWITPMYPYTVVPGNSYTVTVGSGGTGVAGGGGSSGGNSVFDTLTLLGGTGGSGTTGGSTASVTGAGTAGSAGGSGGSGGGVVKTAVAGGAGGSGASSSGGGGAGSPYGTGGTGGEFNGAGGTSPTAGSGFGSGGGGGAATSGGSQSTGGNGAPGFWAVFY